MSYNAVRGGTRRVYFKTYEYTTAGTYSITIPENSTCEVILVGGGGGGTHAQSYWAGIGAWNAYHGGGSAGMIKGTTTLSAGSYSVVVGGGGNGADVSKTNAAASANGGSGGSTSFAENIAGGGGGSYSYASYASNSGNSGSGGSCTVVSEGLVGSNGSAGSGTNRYESYGGGGGSAAKGKGGYAKIIISSTSVIPDYDYYMEEQICKTVLSDSTRTYYKTKEYKTAGSYTFTTVANYQAEVIIVAGGGSSSGTWWNVNGTYSCGAGAGGSGSAFKGYIYLPAGSYTIVVGANGGNSTISGGSVSIQTYHGNNGSSSATSGSGGTGGAKPSITATILSESINRAGVNGGGGGGSWWTEAVYNGGTSLYQGYGAGGNGEARVGWSAGGSNSNPGTAGYVKITISSKSEIPDYDYFVEENGYKAITIE